MTKPGMRNGVVPAAWLTLSEKYRLDARFWLDVLERVNSAWIEHTDLVRVQSVVEQTERDMANYDKGIEKIRASKRRPE